MGSDIKVQGRVGDFWRQILQSERATGQLGSIHGKFSTDWRAARSEFASLPLEKRVMVVHTTQLSAFRLIRQVECTVSYEQDVFRVKLFVELKYSLIYG